MRNSNAEGVIDDCNSDLDKIEHLISAIGATNPISNYLTKYSIIRICGTLEVCYKTIIADYYELKAPLMSTFLLNKVRNATMNPNYQNICTTLQSFDEDLAKAFKDKVRSLNDSDELISAFNTLNKTRNEVAHGISSTISFSDAKRMFSCSLQIINELDSLMV